MIIRPPCWQMKQQLIYRFKFFLTLWQAQLPHFLLLKAKQSLWARSPHTPQDSKGLYDQQQSDRQTEQAVANINFLPLLGLLLSTKTLKSQKLEMGVNYSCLFDSVSSFDLKQFKGSISSFLHSLFRFFKIKNLAQAVECYNQDQFQRAIFQEILEKELLRSFRYQRQVRQVKANSLETQVILLRLLSYLLSFSESFSMKIDRFWAISISWGESSIRLFASCFLCLYFQIMQKALVQLLLREIVQNFSSSMQEIISQYLAKYQKSGCSVSLQLDLNEKSSSMVEIVGSSDICSAIHYETVTDLKSCQTCVQWIQPSISRIKDDYCVLSSQLRLFLCRLSALGDLVLPLLLKQYF